MAHDNQEATNKHKTIYFIDKEKFETDQEQLSVRFLLVDQAKEDPANTTLAKRKGNDLVKFTNLEELVTIENGMKFVVLHNEPTPVSWED